MFRRSSFEWIEVLQALNLVERQLQEPFSSDEVQMPPYFGIFSSKALNVDVRKVTA